MLESSHQYYLITEENQQRIVSLIKRLIGRKRESWLKKILSQIHSTAMANLWHFFNKTEKQLIISLLPSDINADLLAELDEAERTEILKSKNTEWIVDKLKSLEPDDTVDILKGLEKWEANSIIKKFDKTYSQKIKELMKYPEETAGALMTSDFMAVIETATVEKIISQFRKVVEKDELEDLHLIFVVNKQNQFLGYIPLRKLILEKKNKKANEIMSPPLVTVQPGLDQEETARIIQNYDIVSLPVVDDRNVLLGRITIDDIVDVLEKEASEDVYKMVGLNKNEKISNTLSTSLKHRIPWLFVNLFTTSLAAIIVGFFHGTLQKFIILASFMPIVAALGGATGNQMVAMIVRGLATGDLNWKKAKWVLFREINSVIIGSLIIGSLIGFTAYKIENSYILGVIVASALLLNMIFATITGIAIPFLLKFARQDPAWGSSVLVSALTDAMGFLIFLGMAASLLGK
ncbi:MAG: magnesium transporter [Spirochaetia bacterium]|nr:magnesium transporter [Spirochaetia bacterium]